LGLTDTLSTDVLCGRPRLPDSATSPKRQLERATAEDIVRPMKSQLLDRTEFRRSNIADSPDLAAVGLSIRQRMLHLLKRGATTKEKIAEAIEECIGGVSGCPG
jgi:hypothetical protein